MNLLSFGEIIWDVFSEDKQTLGGAPLNFAAYAVLQGADTWVASCVGSDTLGKRAVEEVKALGLNTEFVSVTDKKQTGQCRISLTEAGLPTYNILADVAYDYIALPEKLPTAFDIIGFGTLALRDEYNRKMLESVLANNGFAEIYTDLNIRPPFYSKESIDFCLSKSTIVKISDEELPIVTKTVFGNALGIEEAIAALKEKYAQIKLLLITCGEKGSVCYDCESGDSYSCPASPASVVSTVGAGDSFGATFLVQYEKTKNIPLSLKTAAKVSAFVVEHKEAVPPTAKKFIDELVIDRI